MRAGGAGGGAVGLGRGCRGRRGLPGRGGGAGHHPPAGMPMWGYGARHDMLSQGALDPLMAKAIVIAAGDDKVALVGIDLGRGPTEAMMKVIREEIAAKAGIRHVLITGSHTHHGPVIELTDEPGLGKGKFDAAVAYSKKLPDLLIEAILDADKDLKPARVGVATESVTLNRNRQTKREPKATDPMLAVLRFDDEAGKPIAILVNFAAHPVMTDTKELKYSADYPGFLKNKVEAELSTKCVFMQGAAGDLSTNPGSGPPRPERLRRDARRPRDRAGQVGEDRGPRAPLGQGDGRHLPLQDAHRPGRPEGLRRVREGLLPRDQPQLRQADGRRPERRAEHRADQRRDRAGGGLGRVLLQPRQPAQGAGVRQAHPLLRLLQRPRDVLPHHRGRLRRGLRRRPRRLVRRDRGGRTDDGQGIDQSSTSSWASSPGNRDNRPWDRDDESTLREGSADERTGEPEPRWRRRDHHDRQPAGECPEPGGPGRDPGVRGGRREGRFGPGRSS